MKLNKKEKARRAAKKAARPPRIKPTREQEHEFNKALTFIIILQEVIMRYTSMLVDNPTAYNTVKNNLKAFYRVGNELNESYRKYARQDKRYDDAEELMDIEADYLFELIDATAPLRKADQWIKAVSSVKISAGNVKPPTNPIFIVNSYKWDDRDNHPYTVGVFTDPKKAKECADSHAEYTGEKYVVTVERLLLNTYSEEDESFKAKEVYLSKSSLEKLSA